MSNINGFTDYKKYDRKIDDNEKLLKEIIHQYFESIDEFIGKLPDEEIIELTNYIRSISRRYRGDHLIDVDIEKIKVFIRLFKTLSGNYDANKILSFLESTEYGWHNGQYNLSNPCLRNLLYNPKGHCKTAHKLSHPENAAERICDMYEIFFDQNYGKIALFVFNYCLAALFSTQLKRDNFHVPFFLQIACQRDSVTYQLIEEIVEICDVNSGLFNKCNRLNITDEYCGYIHQIHYPTQSVGKDVNDLVYNKDVPVIIAGHENEHNYAALLRETANIHNGKKSLGVEGKFNFLPIFICPMIKSDFGNVLNMDLTDLEVSKEYLTLLRNSKQALSSLVLILVTDHYKEMFPDVDDDHTKFKYHPLSDKIGKYINFVSQKYPSLTLDNAKNVGILNYFFKNFLIVFQKQCSFPVDEKFICFQSQNGKDVSKNLKGYMDMLLNLSERSLAKLHEQYLPAPTSISVNNKEAIQLARQIEKHYRALKVFIRVVPTEVKKDRYIYNVDTLQETKDSDVIRNSETVQRRLKKYEHFRADFRDKKSIKLIVAEKPLEDNNLIEILQHKDFTGTKMKIPYAIGFDETGAMCIEDIEEFPHLLLGGATRSGKSTAMMSLLMSIAYKHRTGNANVLIMDFLGKNPSDFEVFNNHSFLSYPVITNPIMGRNAILALRKEMDNRLKDKNLPNFPYIVCVIDEFPRLFSDLTSRKRDEELEKAITVLLSGGRQAKIHLVLAAQNPVKKHMVCDIANLPARIALKCAHYKNSEAILGRRGAEKLLGKGQMIFDSPSGQDRRIQGSYITPKDMKSLLNEIENTFEQQNRFPFTLTMAETAPPSEEAYKETLGETQTPQNNSDDSILSKAIMWALPQEKIANSRLQRYLHIANDSANNLLNQMETLGLINRLHANLGWKVLPKYFENISAETIELLTRNGYTENDIKNAFCNK